MLDTWESYSQSNQIQQAQANKLINYMNRLAKDLPAEISVLDFGMGDGKVTERLIDAFLSDLNYHVVGIDKNEKQVLAVRKSL